MAPLSSIVWSCPQDGIFITAKMSDDQVWNRCNHFGRERLSEALEDFIDLVSRAIAGNRGKSGLH